MKRKKNLLIWVGILAVLCAAIAIVTGVEKHVDSISTVSEEIIATSESALTEVSWTTDGETLDFVRATGEDAETDEDGNGVWQSSDDATFPVDQEKMSEFLDHFSSVIASFIIEDVEDYSQYGLSDPQCTITLVSADGTTTIQLGDYSTMDSKRYVTLGGAVYLIDDDLMEYITTDRDDFMQRDSLPDYDTLDAVQATGETAFAVEYLPDETLTYTDDYDYYLNEDGSYKALSTSNVKSFVSTISDALEDADYVTYNASDADLSDYGLDSPAQQVSITSTLDDEQTTVTVAFGQDSKENCYARVDESEIIYQIDSDTYEEITAAGYDTLRPSEVLSLDWDTVESVDITIDDTTYTAKAGKSSWTINDTEVDFDDVEDAVDALDVTEFTSDEPAKKQEIAVAFHCDNDDYPTLSLIAYQYDGESCLVTFGGETVGLVDRDLVVTLIEAVNAITLGLE